LGLTWYDLFRIVYFYAVPVICFTAFVLRALILSSKIYRQQMFFSALSVLLCWLMVFILWRSSFTQPMYISLFTFILTLYIMLLYKINLISMVYDRQALISAVLSFLSRYMSGAVIVGLICILLPKKTPAENIVFLIGGFIIIFFVLWGLYRFETILKKWIHFGNNYGDDLMKELNALDFNDEDSSLVERSVDVIRRNTKATTVDILIEKNMGTLSVGYSTTGRELEISTANEALESLSNMNYTVILKTQAVIKYDFAGIKGCLLELFTTCSADAVIILREGRHIFGLIMLGQKEQGNEYSDYDYNALSGLYSNFFTIGYYMKNISNESIIGVVDREIEFSGQIIHSIQDNIDRVSNEKTDIGFLSLSARNLGGDFVDFIRLTKDRHMFIMGDVSGKGLGASMSMVILKSVIRTLLAETGDFKELVVKINSFIKFHLPKGTFFAGIFCLLDFADNMMYYINCGVPAMFLFTETYNNAIEIQGDGKVLGFVKNIENLIKVKKIKLNPGDMLLATTDGLIDSQSLRGDRFGKDRIQKFILDNRMYPAEKMAHFLYDNLIEFTSKQLEDDVTITVIKYLSR
ncbi:MAG: serine/threonine-protein phosphatase, partial [Spirochaetaceae bacterium]|jgi:hypothetical protein|nr:serine/threonine-protein phosphatase [Spirochaetaceae bacterium]